MKDISGNLLAKGIIYGLTAIDAAPLERRNLAERDDLVHLLHLIVQDPVERERLAVEVERVTGTLADLSDWQGRSWSV